jgi:hypothetical protein
MVSESGGLDLEYWPRIFSLRVIPIYRSSYGGTRVAQTSGPPPPQRSGGPYLAHSRGGVLEPFYINWVLWLNCLGRTSITDHQQVGYNHFTSLKHE